MTDTESPAARRHRFARTLRALSTVDAAAQLLEAYERECARAAPSPADPLDDVDIPWELAEIESLPDWTYATLLQFAIDRRPAPSFQFEGDLAPKVMHAKDLLAGRRYELIGLLAMAVEQAWNLGDKRATTAMAHLCEAAVVQVIGGAGLHAVLGGDDDQGEG